MGSCSSKKHCCQDSSWQVDRRRDRHLLRLWAEVFHVSSTGAGTVKWQQVSEDLVPVNITCIQDSPDCVFHITAYNSQVDKILDVRLVQPGTRIGQASECFVYWKDPSTGDTWGLNFTSPIDAKQFRECCSPSFKFSRKASSNYSLKLEPGRGPGSKQGSGKGARRKPLSTPASPSRAREPQCTCMTAEQYARLRAMQARSATIPRATSRASGLEEGRDKGPSSSSVYDNVHSSFKRGANADNYPGFRQATSLRDLSKEHGMSSHQNDVRYRSQQHLRERDKEREREREKERQQHGTSSMRRKELMATKSVDYSDMERETDKIRRQKSKSTDDVAGSTKGLPNLSLDSDTLKRMLKPMPSVESPVTSPEISRRRGSSKYDGYISEPETSRRFASSKSAHDIGHLRPEPYKSYRAPRGGFHLDIRGPGDMSPPSDNVMFDTHCYATTPSSSNGNSDLDQSAPSINPNSPTSRLLMEYEMHLRNTLAKGMDAESYSLHTFESLLTQSMENLAEQVGVQRPRALLQHHLTPRPKSAQGRASFMPGRRGIEGGRRDSREERHRAYIAAYSDRGYYSDIKEGSRSSRELHRQESDNTRKARLAMYDRQDSSVRQDSLSVRQDSFRQDSIRSGYLSDRERGYASDHSTSGVRERGYSSDHSSSMRDRGYSSDHSNLVHQTSADSADSRLCYLTSSEISDDDRMSLTTAVSDDDDAESVHNSPYKGPKAGTAASFNCTGAVRKAGFLSVKKWLLRKKHQIELARKRGWKGYWVCLKGTTLLFYPCDSREGRSVEAAPKHLIIVDGAIMQPIPEHPKREYIFCLSTAFGDAYLFQAPCQVELENWVNYIHCACAAAFARHRGKTGTLHLLQEEIFRLDRAIDSDNKLKHMAELQLSVVSDTDNKQQILTQISQWEENLERLHTEQFRLRCYMASLQTGELPNPKGLLTHVSKSTKSTLNRLGVFTVSSFHAYICARSPSLLNNLLAGRGATKRRAPMLSRSNSASSRRSLQMSCNSVNDPTKCYTVSLPDNQTVAVSLKDAMSVEEFLASACSRRSLNPMEHFVRVKKRRELENTNYFVPHRTDLIESYIHTHEIVEICGKILYQVELARSSLEQMWGFSVEAELIENSERQDELCCYVSRVEDRSVAMHNGLIKGDEIMVINGAIVSDLDMMYIESVLQEELSLCMMMRSSRTDPPELASILKNTDAMIQSLVCPPPPSDNVISEELLSNLIVPAPWHKNMRSPDMDGCPPPPPDHPIRSQSQRSSSFEIENLLKTADQVTGFCRSPVDIGGSGGHSPIGPGARSGGHSPSGPGARSGGHSPTGSVTSTMSQSHSEGGRSGRQLSDAERLRKVILELVDTEKTYVKHLCNLLENYLEPLKRETFLSESEINTLFGNIHEIVLFQKMFLSSLEEAIVNEPDLFQFDQPYQFKNILFALGSAFLYHANNFKLYSSFCASHSKAQKVLHPGDGNQALAEFLMARNPRQQHSFSMESYLIKPIQRILKYPLLLQQMRNLTSPSSPEHKHLHEALKGMEKVAEHINEMQRIHEEYGAIFDHLFRQHQKSSKQSIDLSPGDLLYYGGVEWLNISDFLGKIKKGLELHAMCFVFKTAVIFLCKERLRQRKKLMGGSMKSSASEVEIIRYQVLIPVTEVQVRASSHKDMDSHFLWELIHLKSQVQRRNEKVYHLSNSTAEFRNAFLRTIRQIIRESVRNMSIPPLKPSQPSGLDQKMIGSTGTLPLNRDKAREPNRGTSTLVKQKRPRGIQRHSAGNIDYDNLDGYDNLSDTGNAFRLRSKTMGDSTDQEDNSRGRGDGPEFRSEGEGEEEEGSKPHPKPMLGKTPNHLSLSTTSTLSAGSTGSQARLIQSSSQPAHYQPHHVKSLADPLPATRESGVVNCSCSPIWKPRDNVTESFTLPRVSAKTRDSEGRENLAVGGTATLPSHSLARQHSGASKTLDC